MVGARVENISNSCWEMEEKIADQETSERITDICGCARGKSDMAFGVSINTSQFLYSPMQSYGEDHCSSNVGQKVAGY